MRAAAAARAGGARGPRREKLARHFARPRPEHYAVLGRFMLSLENEQAALASVTDARSRCETYYYLGLRAQSDGSIRDAARWYARCVESGQSYNFEYHWAHEQLYQWVSSNTSLARLEAAAKHKGARPLAAADP
jgi:lipoprotein NlpI